MLEVISNKPNEYTGHQRMVIKSTLTATEISLVETEDGILTFSKRPKCLSNDDLIDKLKAIKRKHLITTKRKSEEADIVCEAVDELIENVPKMRSDVQTLTGGPICTFVERVLDKREFL